MNKDEGIDKNNIERCIDVPRGWKRRVENDSVVYVSPSQICLRSKEDVGRYLTSDRTCKCGLDCPLYIDKAFNFDASTSSRHFKITKLENDHKTLCKETIKARFATLAQTQSLIKKEAKVNKPVVIKKKSEVFVTKDIHEAPKLPSFETFTGVTAEESNPSKDLVQEATKPKRPRKPALHKQKSDLNVTSAESTAEMQRCQTVHLNTMPILHSSIHKFKDSQYPAVSTAVGTVDRHLHPANRTVGPLFTFPSTHLNASSFLASLSSGAPTIPGQTPASRADEPNHAQKFHLYSGKSFGQKPSVFCTTPSETNNRMYHLSNQNSKVNWQAGGLPLPRLPSQNRGNADIPSLEKSKGGFTMKTSLPTVVPTARTTTTPVSHVSSMPKVQIKPQDLQQIMQKQQTSTTVKTSIVGRTEPILPAPGYSTTVLPNAARAPSVCTTNPGETPFQYCGILLQPGVVPHVQLTGAAPQPTSVGSQSIEQNQYSNLYALQGIPYANNLGAAGNVLGMTSNTIIPYFLGITQPNAGTGPKPTVPSTNSSSPSKESSASSTASNIPVSTSAIAAAYSAFVSIAPAGLTSGPVAVTNCSFSQQLVNLVSNYNNPYWQHLLTQGANSNALAYQLMQISQYASTRSAAQTTKSSSARGQSKVTSSKSFGSQESKTKVSARDSVLSSASAVSSTTAKTANPTLRPEKSSTVGCTALKPSVVVTTTVEKSPAVVNATVESHVVITTAAKSDDVNSKTMKTSDLASADRAEKSVVVTDSTAESDDGKNLSVSAVTSTKIMASEITITPEVSKAVICSTMNSGSTALSSHAVTSTITKTSDVTSTSTIVLGTSTMNVDGVTSTTEKSSAVTSTFIESDSTTSSTAKSDDATSSTVMSSTTTGKCSMVVSTNVHSGNIISPSAIFNAETINLEKSSADMSVTSDGATSTALNEERKIGVTNELGTSDLAVQSSFTSNSFAVSSEDDSPEEISKKPGGSIREKTGEESPVDPDGIGIITQRTIEKSCEESGISLDKNAPSPQQVSEETPIEETSRDYLHSASVEAENDRLHEVNEEKVDSETSRQERVVIFENNSSITKSEEENTLENECTNVTSGAATDVRRNDADGKIDEEEDMAVSEENMKCVDEKEPLAVQNDNEVLLGSTFTELQNSDHDCKAKDKEMYVSSILQNGENESASNDAEKTDTVNTNKKELSEYRAEFTIGDVVWAQARGLPSWPGKIVDERDVGSGKADVGKKWVMWFGDHTFSQVEVEKLKTLTDGLKTLDDKGRKRKYRGKRTRMGLEKAIGEALEELDQRERLRSRQGPKAKKRRL